MKSVMIAALVAVAAARPAPQGVTEAIAPPAAVPSQCAINYGGKFGIAVITDIKKARVVAPSPAPKPKAYPGMERRDPQAMGAMPGMTPAAAAAGAAATPDSTVTVKSTRTHTRTVTVRPFKVTAAPAAPAAAPAGPMAAPEADMGMAGAQGMVKIHMISQIADGQIQAPMTPVPVSVSTMMPSTPAPGRTVTQIADGQIQAPMATQIPDGQIQAPKSKVAGPIAAVQRLAVNMPGVQRLAGDGPGGVLVACEQKNTLGLSLNNGILKDSKGRTGYIASNRQFQFDDPPQHGSIYTAGFSICNNGTLALGGSSVWWQCRSGDFYNLYDQWIAPQCQPIHINAIRLNTC